MQKTEITLSFDGEKLDALEFYLKKENTTVQKRMNEALTELYERIVPEAVRFWTARRRHRPDPNVPPAPAWKSPRRRRPDRKGKLLWKRMVLRNEKQRNMCVAG